MWKSLLWPCLSFACRCRRIHTKRNYINRAYLRFGNIFPITLRIRLQLNTRHTIYEKILPVRLCKMAVGFPLCIPFGVWNDVLRNSFCTLVSIYKKLPILYKYYSGYYSCFRWKLWCAGRRKLMWKFVCKPHSLIFKNITLYSLLFCM